MQKVYRLVGVCQVPRVLAVLLIACTIPVHLAAQGRQAPPPGQGPGDAVVSPAEIQRMLDGYMLIQAQETLQLTDEQFPRFLARVRTLQETRRRMQGERQRLLQELRRMTTGRAGPVDDERLKDRLKALDDLEARAAVEIKQNQTAVDQVLTPIQQARFRIFEEMTEQRKIELLMRARQGRGRQGQPFQP
jgi:Spy/CpxP family protein refolding chaperone